MSEDIIYDKNNAYHVIEKDSIVNSHARELLSEIHKFANENKNTKFMNGEVTLRVLQKVIDGSIISKNIPQYELQQMSKTYLRFVTIRCDVVDEDLPTLK
jgi:hypothetical protein